MNTTYTISYKVPPPTSLAILSMEVFLKKSVLVTPYIQVDTTPNPVINQVYTFTTPSYPIHEIYDIYVSVTCDDIPVPSTQFGDRSYLVKTTPNPITVTPQVASFDVTWDSFLDPVAVIIPADTSLDYYLLEYRLSGSTIAWSSVTLTATQMALNWQLSGLFPSHTETISAGIISGLTYDIKLTTVLKYNYITGTGPQLTNIMIPGSITTETAL